MKELLEEKKAGDSWKEKRTPKIDQIQISTIQMAKVIKQATVYIRAVTVEYITCEESCCLPVRSAGGGHRMVVEESCFYPGCCCCGSLLGLGAPSLNLTEP